MFHLRFGLSDHLKALLDFVFGSRRRVKKVRIFRAWFSQCVGPGERKKISNKEEVEVRIRVNRLVLSKGGERKRNLNTIGLCEKQRK